MTNEERLVELVKLYQTLSKYARHKYDCELATLSFKTHKKCTCGVIEALINLENFVKENKVDK